MLVLLAIAVLVIQPVSAQTGDPGQQAAILDSLVVPEPLTAIPTTEVPKRAEETSADLRGIRGTTGWDPGIFAITQEYPEVSAEIDQRKAEIGSLAVEKMPAGELAEELQWWERERSRLNGWAPKISNRSRKLVSALDEVRDLRTTWELTRDSAEEVEMPVAILERVNSVLLDIDTVYTLVSARIDTVLTLQDQVSQKLVFVDETISGLKETQGHVQRMLFATDSPPIWKLIFADRDSADLRETASASWRSNWDGLRTYAARYSSRFIDQLIAAVLVFLAILALAWQSRRWSVEDDKDLETAVAILKRPLAIAILITCLFPGVFHPQAPSSVGHLMQLLLLFPLIRLLPAVASPDARKPIYYLAVLFTFDQVLHLAPELSGLQRLLQIGLAGLSIFGLVWLYRIAGRSILSVTWLGVMKLAVRLVVALLLVSVVGNILGYATLANHLLSSTMICGYYVILIAAAYRVARAVLAAVLQTNMARKLRGIRLHTPLIRRKAYQALLVAAVVVVVWGTLRVFEVWNVVSDVFISFVDREWTFGSISLSIGNLVLSIFAVWVAVQVSRFVQFVLSEDVLPHLSLARGVPSAITRVTGIIIVGFGIVLAAGVAGVDLNKFSLLAGALGVGIGFGMQNIVNNFMSGLILIFERPISAGDLIQFGTTWGTVQRIGFRSSTIRTFSGADVIVPNGNLISAEVINWSRSDQLRRVEVKVGVEYGTDPSTVIDVLENAIRTHPDVLEEPAPYAVFHGFGDSSLDFEIRGWTMLDDWLRVSTETRVIVNNALKDAGIGIPFPQRDLHLRTMDPEVEGALTGRKIKPTAGGEKPPSARPASGRTIHSSDQDMDGDAE